MKIGVQMRFVGILVLVIMNSTVQSKEDTTKLKEELEKYYQYEILPAGEIKPGGWIKNQLERDLSQGYIGHFDNVHHTVTHNVFVKQNRTSTKQYRIIKEWWSGEHEGYWKDAVIRMAFLSGHKKYQEQAHIWMNELVENTGKNGYIGIYADCERPVCRFNHKKGNGELWATSRILMAMLAYYEFTGEQKVLDAAEKAAKLIMHHYNDKNYFSKESKGGGVSHGIGFFENLEWLYRLTGDESYLQFSVKLYEDFNNGRVRDDDLKTHRLLDEDRYFRKHGAHIAEGMFVPTFIANLRNEERYNKAADKSLEKLYYHMTPGGAMRCDEWINGRRGTADELYEYCGIAEMVGPLNKIITMTGDLSIADRIEKLTFNAGQGSRFSPLRGLSYLTSDNRIHINHREIGKRESYDAAHRAAACCVLNGGRLMPYYVEGMWMKDLETKGITAMLYGPSELNTTIRDTKVNIVEDTDYPFGDKIRFTVNPEKPINFALTLRKPHGVNNFETTNLEEAKVNEYKDKIVITKDWQKDDQFDVHFKFDVKKIAQPESKTVPNGGYFLQRGALVYALQFDHDIDTVKEYNNSGYYRYKIKATNTDKWDLKIDEETPFEYTDLQQEPVENPFDEPVVKLEGSLTDKNGNTIPVTLIPEGNTVFRRVTFPEVQTDIK
ncbi:MAG: hypothetical protein GVY19_09000 [Bacteroidetes bacterium]|jgi:DUF1680 family protein|nr:hypothetical protein [Bacteroidota bacterium]